MTLNGLLIRSAVNKTGECPNTLSDQRQQHQHSDDESCSNECHTDADCRGDNKCCAAGCSYVCVPPAVEAATEQAAEPPVHRPRPPTVHYPGAKAAELEPMQPEDVNVVQAAGAVATLRCFATGYPLPTVSWRFGAVIVSGWGFTALVKKTFNDFSYGQFSRAVEHQPGSICDHVHR